jgi:hypothetical protein
MANLRPQSACTWLEQVSWFWMGAGVEGVELCRGWRAAGGGVPGGVGEVLAGSPASPSPGEPAPCRDSGVPRSVRRAPLRRAPLHRPKHHPAPLHRAGPQALQLSHEALVEQVLAFCGQRWAQQAGGAAAWKHGRGLGWVVGL